MKVYAYVNQAEALRRGIDAAQPLMLINVNPTELNQEDRDLIASSLEEFPSEPSRGRPMGLYAVERPSNNIILTVSEPTVGGLVEALVRNRQEKLKKQAREEQLDREAKELHRQQTMDVLRERKTATKTWYAKADRRENGDLKVTRESYFWGVSVPYKESVPDWPYHLDADVANSPEALQWVQALETENADAFAEAAAAAKKRLLEAEAEAQAEEEAEEEAAHRRREQLRNAVLDYGTEGQKARLAEGFLADEEALNLLRDRWFDPLDGWPRYEKIKASEVCQCSDGWDEDQCHIVCEVEDCSTLTDAQYDNLQKARKTIPDAKVTPRDHTCTASECEAVVTRQSLHVSITRGEITLTREYAL